MDDGEVLYVLADKESGAQDLFVLLPRDNQGEKARQSG
jgi:hypothetical protein